MSDSRTTGHGRSAELLRKALLASVTARVSLCEEVFTSDVTCQSPVLTATSRDDLETQLSSRADALADVELTLDRVIDGDVMVAEWRISATLVGPYLVAGAGPLDRLGERLELAGVSLVGLRGDRVSWLRHYFDPSVLLPGAASRTRSG